MMTDLSNITENLNQINPEDIANIKLQIQNLNDTISGGLRSANIKEYRNTYVINAQDSLDASYPMYIHFNIIPEMVKIVSIAISFWFLNFRAYSTAASSGGAVSSASGGSSTPTSSSGGAQTSSSGGAQTTSSGGSSTPTSSSGGGQTTSEGGATTPTSSSGGGVTSATESQDHTHRTQIVKSSTAYNTVSTDGVSLYANVGASFYVPTDSPSRTHTHTVANHTHTVTIGNHTHTVANHTHTVTIAAHTHTVDNHTIQ